MAQAPHLTVPLHSTIAPERETWSGVIEGDFTELQSEAAAYKVGDIYEGVLDAPVYGPICDDVQPNATITQFNLQRKDGMLGELSFAYTFLRKAELWSCDMAEISKDIKTWLTTEQGGFTDADAAVELAKIAQWEAFKDNGDFVRWQNFQYDDNGNVLTGTPLVLAKKIVKGIQSYSIFAPVITKTTLWNVPPPMENYGKRDTPSVRSGWFVIGGEPSWASKASAWLKTGCKSSPNSDGTYTLFEQWTGADEIDGDLYPSATSGTGGTRGTGGTE